MRCAATTQQRSQPLIVLGRVHGLQNVRYSVRGSVRVRVAELLPVQQGEVKSLVQRAAHATSAIATLIVGVAICHACETAGHRLPLSSVPHAADDW